MATKSKFKEEELSVSLLKLYRLAYESIVNGSVSDNVFLTYFPDYSGKKSVKTLIKLIPKLLSNSKDKLIYGQSFTLSDVKNAADVSLFEYCKNDLIDEAILLLLNYKLNNTECVKICSYSKESSGGWSHFTQTSIHCIMSNMKQSTYFYNDNEEIKKQFKVIKIDQDDKKKSPEKVAKIEFENKETKIKKEKYISSVIFNKYSRRLFLFELFLREKTPTTIKYKSGGWHTKEKNDSVFQTALSLNNNDLLDLLFKYGNDIEVNNPLNTNDSTNKSNSFTKYRPIHTAVKDSNYKLTELLVKKGADITIYKIYFYQHDYGTPTDRQETLLYLAHKLNDKNKMLKLILNNYNSSRNGLIDVNSFCVEIKDVPKEKEVYAKEVEDTKKRIKADKARYAQDNDNDYMDEYEYDINNDRGEYYVERYKQLYCYKTMLHVAIMKLDIELIKVLLIYGADTSLKMLRSPIRTAFHSGRRRQNIKEEERSKVIRKWYDDIGQHDKSAQDIYAILDNTKKDDDGDDDDEDDEDEDDDDLDVADDKNDDKIKDKIKNDDKIKDEIKKLLKSEKIWFPDLIHLYPNNMGKCLQVIMAETTEMPKEVTDIIIKYFYTVF